MMQKRGRKLKWKLKNSFPNESDVPKTYPATELVPNVIKLAAPANPSWRQATRVLIEVN